MMLTLCVCLLAICATRSNAQSQTTVIGNVVTPAGAAATSGTVSFTLIPSSASILYYVSGLNVIAPTVGTCGIDGSGNIKSQSNLANPCLVWGNDVITPGNTTYTVQFYPNGIPSQNIRQLLISGTTFSFAAPRFTPQVQINPQYATIYASAIQGNVVPAVGSVFNIGSSGLRYAAGYFDNLFVTNSFAFTNLTVSGPLHVTGTSTLDGVVTSAGGFVGGLTGNVTGNVTGNLTGNSTGTHTGPVVGNVTGNLTGNVTGNVVGNISGGTAAHSTISATGQITSTLAIGTSPFVITSTTPVANLAATPTTYNHSGTQAVNAHVVIDTCVLGTSCSVTLTGASVFTSSSSYVCSAQDTTAAAATKIVQSSGSAFAITGTGTDTLQYVCAGD